MESLLLFLHIISWTIAVPSTILASIATYKSFMYSNSLEETVDKLKGITRVFNHIKFWMIALICWAFIISF